MEHTEEIRRKERLGYIVLQHVHTLGADPLLALLPDAVATALAISPDEVREILGMLAQQGYVTWTSPNDSVTLTADGEDYLLQRARRRKSVRFKSILKGSPQAGDGSRSPPLVGPDETAQNPTERSPEPQEKPR